MDDLILQCHSKGDKRFSAFGAKLADGRMIEHIYQQAKRGKNGEPLGKGKTPSFICIMGKNIACEKNLRYEFYLMLWIIYFMENPRLLIEARKYSAFIDIYDGKGGQTYHPGDSYITDGSTCQAAAIAWLVGTDEEEWIEQLPRVLIGAFAAYWNKNHEQNFQMLMDITKARKAIDYLLSVDKKAIAYLDQRLVSEAKAKLAAISNKDPLINLELDNIPL